MRIPLCVGVARKEEVGSEVSPIPLFFPTQGKEAAVDRARRENSRQSNKVLNI